MNSEQWGPIAWYALHGVLSCRPGVSGTKAKEHADDLSECVQARRLMLLALADVLPCRKCRKNYTTNSEKAVIEMCSDQALAHPERLLWHVHNMVNKANGKRSVPFEELESRVWDHDLILRQSILFLLVVCHNADRFRVVPRDKAREFVYLFFMSVRTKCSSAAMALAKARAAHMRTCSAPWEHNARSLVDTVLMIGAPVLEARNKPLPPRHELEEWLRKMEA